MDTDGKTFWVFNGYGAPNNAWGIWLASFLCMPEAGAVTGRRRLAEDAGAARYQR